MGKTNRKNCVFYKLWSITVEMKKNKCKSDQKRIKVVTINCMINEGSTSKIIKDVEKLNQNECEFYHCYQIGPKGDEKNYLVSPWNVTRFYFVLSRLTGLKYGVGNIPTRFLLQHIARIDPDVIHIHCPNFYSINLYMLFRQLKKKKYPVLITNHAEFFYTGNCAHADECKGYLTGCHNCERVFDKKYKYIFNRTAYEWKKMKESFSDACNFVMTVVSPWQYKRIHTSPLIGNINVRIVENAANSDVFKKKEVDYTKYQVLMNYRKKIILNVTSNFSDNINDMKGGYYLLQIAKMLPECLFVIAGNYNIENMSQIGENVILLGNIKNQEQLSEYYNIADLVLVTSKKETFGMSCAESMLCGTPVIGFEAGGTESIALLKYSEFVKYGEIEKVVSLIEKWKNIKSDITDELAEQAKARYSIERMAGEFLEIYKEISESR